MGVDSFLDHIVTHLMSAFPDHRVLDAFRMFSPRDRRSGNVINDQRGLDILLDHFSKDQFDPEQTKLEWQILQYIIGNPRYHLMDMAEFMASYLHRSRAMSPNLSALVAIGLCIPLTSVSCERGISAYNAIKTDQRNQLSVHVADQLMMLYLQDKGIQNFNFSLAFDKWLSIKDRKGFNTMVKKCKAK